MKAKGITETKGTTEATGIVRKVDELGRVTLPSEIRYALGIEERTPLHIWMEGDLVYLRKQDAEKEKLQFFMEFISAKEELIGEDLVAALRDKLAGYLEKNV